MDLRTIDGDELEAWIESNHVPFFVTGSAAEEVERRRPMIDLDRTWAAFEGSAMVGTFRTFETELTTPGGQVAADAVTNVGVSPTHRRRGVMSEMIEASFRAAVERGEPLSILIAAEYPIYGRFGYGPATETATYTIDARRARFQDSSAARVQLVTASEARQVAPALYESLRPRQVGAIRRRDYRWDHDLGLTDWPGSDRWKGYCVLAYAADGTPAGFLRYHADSTWEGRQPRGTLFVDELLSDSTSAYAALWQYACEVDWMITVKADDRRVDEPLPWLLHDARAARQTSRSDFLWVRILDVAAALGGRRFAAEGRVVLEVTDPAGIPGGRFMLECGADGARCQPSTSSPEVALPVGTLAAAYLGGARLASLYEAGKLDEEQPGAVARLDALFQTPQAPWCNTWF